MTISRTTMVAAAIAMAAVFGAGCGAGASDPLVGTWTRLRADATARDQYSFGTDGSFTFDENVPGDPASEDHMSGTYEATATTVVATVTNTRDGGRARLTFSYYANASSFSSAALHPVAAHQGIVGTWDGQVAIDILSGDTIPVTTGAAETDVFRADGTFQVTSLPHDSALVQTWAGTYLEQSPGTFVLTGSSGSGGVRTVTWQMLDGAALVGANRIWLRQ